MHPHGAAFGTLTSPHQLAQLALIIKRTRTRTRHGMAGEDTIMSSSTHTIKYFSKVQQLVITRSHHRGKRNLQKLLVWKFSLWPGCRQSCRGNKKKYWGERGSNSRPQDNSRLAMRPTRWPTAPPPHCCDRYSICFYSTSDNGNKYRNSAGSQFFRVDRNYEVSIRN